MHTICAILENANEMLALLQLMRPVEQMPDTASATV